MKIEITIYKNNGKFYTNEEVEIDDSIAIWSDEFKKFIRKHSPANIGEGFVVTRAIGDGFCDGLWRYHEIYS